MGSKGSKDPTSLSNSESPNTVEGEKRVLGGKPLDREGSNPDRG